MRHQRLFFHLLLALLAAGTLATVTSAQQPGAVDMLARIRSEGLQHSGALPLYRTLDISGPEHRRGFVVEVEVEGNVAQGSGQSKRAAEEAAAAKLLELVTHER